MLNACKFMLMLFFIPFSTSVFAAPKSELWAYWQQEEASNQQTIDHSVWQEILNSYLAIDGQHNLFDYQSVTAQHKKALKGYIEDLASIDPRAYKKDVQFAYWVNLYNALTVNLILQHYPVSSIKKIGGFFSFGPWDEKLIDIANKSLSLNDIEHRILRPIWQDARIHYVVNCASLGCPNLPINALTAKNKDAELEQAAIAFINSPKGVKIKGNTLILSSIYDWYGSDFGKEQKQILESIDLYRTGENLHNWQRNIQYQYDWQLNETE